MTALPTVLRREAGEEEVFVLALEPDHLVFQGHFPGNPILPGVVQVDWAIRLGTQAFGPLGDFQGISNLKFMSIIQPLEPLELRLTFDREAGKLGFRYEGSTGRKSTGVIRFAVRD
jgi:3-hydroxymyristoyl/3-hydroxydecanoyl-(acyl carrier protein) dehydratase